MLYKKALSKGLPNIKKKPGDVYIAILSHGKTPVSSEWTDFLWLEVPGIWAHVTATSCTMFFTDKLYRKRRLIKWKFYAKTSGVEVKLVDGSKILSGNTQIRVLSSGEFVALQTVPRNVGRAPLPVISQQMQTNIIGNSGQTNTIKTEAFSADLLRIFRKM